MPGSPAVVVGRSPASAGDPVVEIHDLSRRFGRTQALLDVSLEVRAGEIHALLGPNGAGKTTLLRIMCGLVDPDSGHLRILGVPWQRLSAMRLRQLVGLVPSGDRSFYLRISGLENLVFFGRLHGLRRADAARRAWGRLRDVDLEEAARDRVGGYSHGMQKRLSIARALLMDPALLLVDEATHDLDPDGAQRVRDLAVAAAGRGAAVIWATQRVDEIRGFVDRLTLLHRGKVRFRGTVPQLLAVSTVRNHLLRLRNGTELGGELLATARAALRDLGAVTPSSDADGEHFLMSLRDDVTLGEGLAALMASGIEIIACREGRPEIEDAFLKLTGGERR